MLLGFFGVGVSSLVSLFGLFGGVWVVGLISMGYVWRMFVISGLTVGFGLVLYVICAW